jgi:hypothetical protein
LKSWIGRIGLFALFGPFAIVYIYGFFFGDAPPMNQFFGSWFMGSLTIAGVIGTFEFSKSVKVHGPNELGCVLPLAAITCFWGYIFLKGLGFFR